MGNGMVSGALFLEHSLPFGDALGYVRALRVDRNHHADCASIITDLRIVIADAANGLSRDFVEIQIRLGGQFPSDHAQSSRDQRFDRHAALRVLRQRGVQYRVRHLIADFVRVTFGDGL